MNSLEILQAIRKRKRKGKGLYPYQAHRAGDSSGPAQLHGRAGDRGDIEGVLRVGADPTRKRLRMNPPPLNGARPTCQWLGLAGRPTGGARWQVHLPPPAQIEEEAEGASAAIASTTGHRWRRRRNGSAQATAPRLMGVERAAGELDSEPTIDRGGGRWR